MRGFVRDTGRRTLRRPRARTGSRGEDALVPLINVVFLMVIFFMLAGQIRPPDILRVERPVSVQGRFEDAAHVELWMDADGRLALGERVLPLETLIEDLRVRLDARGETRILLNADGDVPAARLRTLMQRLRGLGVEQLLIVAHQG